MPDTELEPIPMLDLKGEVEELWDEINTAIQRVLRSGQFILGSEVEAFEEEVADFLGVKHAVGLNSGTDALVIGLEALGIGPGDEVITTAFSFFATSEAIMRVGATPVFVDIDEATFNIDPDLIEPAITERTKAILPVHLFGLPADMSRILDIAKRHKLLVLEDAAQAFGARVSALEGRRVGSLGDAAAFSFYPTKNLGAYGDAGLLATNIDELAAIARSLRDHGARPGEKYVHDRLGYNSRLDALQAAILRVKLPRVDAANRGRWLAAEAYDHNLAFVEGIQTPALHADHVFHQYSVLVCNRLAIDVQRVLLRHGVHTAKYYPRPLHLQPAHALAAAPENVRSVGVSEAILALPIASRSWNENAAHISQVLVSEWARVPKDHFG